MPGDFPGAPGSDPSIMGGAFRNAAWILRREWARVIGLSILVVTPLYGALMMGLSVVFYTAFFHRLVAARGSRGEIAAQVFD